LALTGLLAVGAGSLPTLVNAHSAKVMNVAMKPAMAPTSMSAASDLRLVLNRLLAEHVVLATSATNAAIGGRDGEFKAAAGALDANSVELSKAIASVYGKPAGDAFLPLWRKHIGFFVDYTVGLATKDQTKANTARAAIIGYADDFAAFLNSASPDLPVDAVAKLVRVHGKTLRTVIELQVKGDQAGAYKQLRVAIAHMQNIADPLSETIVKQFSAKFM
ncbi:MAG: hypothetical protein ACC634_08325, partial [Hyphomicrobiales bacterium]